MAPKNVTIIVSCFAAVHPIPPKIYHFLIALYNQGITYTDYQTYVTFVLASLNPPTSLFEDSLGSMLASYRGQHHPNDFFLWFLFVPRPRSRPRTNT